MNAMLPAPPAPPAHRSGGIVVMLAALACFGALDTTTKLVSSVVPVAMAIWVRYVLQSTTTGALIWSHRRSGLLRTSRPLMHIARGLLLVTTNVIAFVSLRHMHVGEFTAIVMLTPLLLTVVAASALREHVSWARWLCVVVGFAGTIVVIRPDENLLQWVTLLPLLLVLANAAFQVLTSRLARTDEPLAMHFYTGLAGFALATGVLPFAWEALSWRLWSLLCLLGVIGTLGHFLLIVAYSRAPVAMLTPYLYLQIGFGALGAWWVFDHVPDPRSIAGIGLIVIGGIFGTWLTGREALARERIGRGDAESSLAAMAAADGH